MVGEKGVMIDTLFDFQEKMLFLYPRKCDGSIMFFKIRTLDSLKVLNFYSYLDSACFFNLFLKVSL